MDSYDALFERMGPLRDALGFVDLPSAKLRLDIGSYMAFIGKNVFGIVVDFQLLNKSSCNSRSDTSLNRTISSV